MWIGWFGQFSCSIAVAFTTFLCSTSSQKTIKCHCQRLHQDEEGDPPLLYPSSLPRYLASSSSSGFGSSSCSILISSSDQWLVVVLYVAPCLLCCCRPFMLTPAIVVQLLTVLLMAAPHFCWPLPDTVLSLSLPAAACLSHK
jgi:hypothetical protein